MVKGIVLFLAILLLVLNTLSVNQMKEECFGWKHLDMNKRIGFFIGTAISTILNGCCAWYIIHFYLNDFGH